MKIFSSLILILVWNIFAQAHYRDEFEDNEFAEFDDFEDDDVEVQKMIQDKLKLKTGNIKVNIKNDVELESLTKEDLDDELLVEDEDSEFEHFQDEEEFEGFDDKVGSKLDDKETPKITITKVPLHFRTNWNSYYLELLMLSGLIVYGLNFFTGRNKNNKIANAWFNTHKSLLEENFSLVGDDCKAENECPGLMKDSEHLYTLWCSGRTCCEGMLVELKFIKRQDLVALISQMIRPISDQIHIKIDMNKEDMDTFVFCLGTKKTAARLVKDLADLNTYCPDKKSVDKFGLPANFVLHSEIPEATQSLFDSRVITVLNKYHDMIDYLHFSDQFSGPKTTEDVNVTKLPETKKVLMFGFNLLISNCHSMDEAIEAMRPLLQLVFYMVDKVKRFKLSKEAKTKADKNRLRVEEAFMKTTHAARAEAAAARREEKRRQEKERILQEDDPDKQRKWEDREMKRQLKKKAPKMKQLKVKAL